MMHHDTYGVGLQGEHLVIIDLVSKGFVAFQGQAGLPYDLVLDVGDDLLRVQIKTKSHAEPRSPNIYTFKTREKTKANNERNYSRVDLFAFVALDIGKVFYEWNCDIRVQQYSVNTSTGLNLKERKPNWFKRKKTKKVKA